MKLAKNLIAFPLSKIGVDKNYAQFWYQFSYLKERHHVFFITFEFRRESTGLIGFGINAVSAFS